MNITIEIPQLDGLTAAINNLASAYSGSPSASAPAKTTKAKAEPKPDASSAEGASSGGSAPVTDKSIDAGTGKSDPVDPPVETLQLTPAGIKTMLAKLTQMPEGMAKASELLEKYGAKKFSDVPTDKLADFAQDLIAAGVQP